MYGVIVRGICKGTRREQRGRYVSELVGLVLRRDDGYGGQQDELIEIEIPKVRMETGIQALLQGFIGNVIEVPVWVKPWASKRGALCVSYIMSNEGEIVRQQPARSVVASKPSTVTPPA